jgi:secreted trypsin-like serine protease
MASYRQIHSRTPLSLERISGLDDPQSIDKFSPPRTAMASTNQKESTRKCLQEIRNQISIIDSNIKNSTAKIRSLNDKSKIRAEPIHTNEKQRAFNASWGVTPSGRHYDETANKTTNITPLQGEKRKIRFADEDENDLERRLIALNKDFVESKEEEIKKANKNLGNMLEQLDAFKLLEEDGHRRRLADIREVFKDSILQFIELLFSCLEL